MNRDIPDSSPVQSFIVILVGIVLTIIAVAILLVVLAKRDVFKSIGRHWSMRSRGRSESESSSNAPSREVSVRSGQLPPIDVPGSRPTPAGMPPPPWGAPMPHSSRVEAPAEPPPPYSEKAVCVVPNSNVQRMSPSRLTI